MTMTLKRYHIPDNSCFHPEGVKEAHLLACINNLSFQLLHLNRAVWGTDVEDESATVVGCVALVRFPSTYGDAL